MGDLLMRIRNTYFLMLFIFLLSTQIYSEFLESNIPFLIGNGNLLVGIGKNGNISFARWLGVGGNNHIGNYSLEKIPKEKPLLEPTAFLLQTQGTLYSLSNSSNSYIQGNYIKPEIPLLEFKGEIKDIEITWQQEIFVHPDKDVTYCHFSINSIKDKSENFIAYQNITPQPLPIADNPFLENPNSLQKDFCVFWDPTLETLIYFRPYKAGKADIYRLQKIERDTPISPKFWRKFEEGVYIGVISLNPIKGANIFHYPLSDNEFLNIGKQDFTLNLHYLDDFCSSLVIQPQNIPNNFQEVFICYVFAKSYSEMEEIVRWVRMKSYEQVKEEVISHWETRWATTSRSIKYDFVDEWLKITLCTDPVTGAIPIHSSDPILGNRISLEDSFFLVQSMNDMNMNDYSKKLISFWYTIGKKQLLSAKPTFPLWVYSNGTSASPDYWTDITQTAFFTSMIYILSENMSFQEKKDFLNEIWDVLVWGINNLCLWKIPGDLLPAPSFTEKWNRDSQTANLLIQTIIGIQQGIQLAKTIYMPIPELWETRNKELQTYIRLTILNNKPLEFILDKNFFYWQKFFPENDILWQLPVKHNGRFVILKDVK